MGAAAKHRLILADRILAALVHLQDGRDGRRGAVVPTSRFPIGRQALTQVRVQALTGGRPRRRPPSCRGSGLGPPDTPHPRAARRGSLSVIARQCGRKTTAADPFVRCALTGLRIRPCRGLLRGPPHR